MHDIKSAPTGVKLVLMQMAVLFVGLGLPHANVYKARCKIGAYGCEIGIGENGCFICRRGFTPR
ncbi:hypothetical protein C1E23_00240 [Pseudoalteromonas phenolica]|uniref:Uncharacterized protein n=1 Tax=Pseudoalteromonas phenolica TaxID=161398 RepID=A0A4Q7IT29_9GAMM|nr:hypothetical protein [Pseudoalteromonas phenolica]RZQ55162.1 hypothetical protein C1E23_00240 [Pseudoalteromonas phenolica]